MAEYQCVVKTKQGKRSNRLVTADNPSAVIRQLKKEGLLAVKVDKASSKKVLPKRSFSFFKDRVSTKEVAVFTRQLGVMLTSGILLTEALDAVAENLENAYFKEIIEEVKFDVRCGTEFSTALKKYPHVFSDAYRAIVRVGEATGKLNRTLKNLAQYLEDSERLKEKVKSAIRYPMFVAGFAITVIGIMTFFLIPQFADMFNDFNAQLPWLTRVVVGTSNFCIRNVWWCLLGLILLWAVYMYSLRYPQVHRSIDVMKLKIPIIGKNIIHKALLARYSRTLGFMLEAGVSLTQSLEITSEVVDHVVMAEAVNEIKDRVVGGSSISKEMSRQKIFTGLSTKMTSIGERSGRLTEMFDRTSEYYEDEMESTLENLTAILEPVLIVFVGLNVLIVVLALYLPIFHLSTAIR